MNATPTPSDLTPLLSEARRLYRNCKATECPEYTEISREVRSLHTVLKHLRYELRAPESILNRRDERQGSGVVVVKDLKSIVRDCAETLEELRHNLESYDRQFIAIQGGSGKRYGARDTLSTIRTSLISLKTNITVLLDTVQLRECGRAAYVMERQNGQLGLILDKVDRIAVRMNAAREGSVLTTYEDDDKEVWKQFRRELVAEGFDSEVLSHHKDVLRAYIRQIEQNGMLQHDARDSGVEMASKMDPVAWLRDVPIVQSPVAEMEQIPARLDDMNYDRRNPNETTFKNDTNQVQPLTSCTQSQPVVELDAQQTNRQTGAASTFLREKSSGNLQTSRHQDSECMITTMDLFKLNASTALVALDIPQPNITSNHHSTVGLLSVSPSAVPQLLSTNKTVFQAGTSPKFSNASMEHARFDGRAATLNLAPDQNGNPIPPYAKWTKVKRSQVSPEILAQDNRRYEIRQDFVAVLGILTIEQIQDYAARTLELRQSRARSARPPQLGNTRHSARWPPRRYDLHDNSSDPEETADHTTCTSSTSETDSSNDSRYYQRRRHKYCQYERSSRSQSSRSKSQDRPNGISYTYGSAPFLSPRQPSTSQRANNTSVAHQGYPTQTYDYTALYNSGNSRFTTSFPPPTFGQHQPLQPQRVRFKDEEPFATSVRLNHRNSTSGIIDYDSSRNMGYSGEYSGRSGDTKFNGTMQQQQQTQYQQKKKSSWRSAMTGTGLGVAAGGMLSVLLEAAQDLDF